MEDKGTDDESRLEAHFRGSLLMWSRAAPGEFCPLPHLSCFLGCKGSLHCLDKKRTQERSLGGHTSKPPTAPILGMGWFSAERRIGRISHPGISSPKRLRTLEGSQSLGLA